MSIRQCPQCKHAGIDKGRAFDGALQRMKDLGLDPQLAEG